MLNTSFLVKELKEAVKTRKLIILMSLFVFFAILSPLTGRYINEILSSLGPDIEITFPDPTLIDAWAQYFKNFSSLCVIVYLIIMTGSVSQEKNKGSILIVLTKRVSRLNFALSKLIGGIFLFTLCYVASILVSGLYTYLLFDGFIYEGLWISLLMMWMMGVFFTALAIFFSIITKTPTVSALFGFLGFAVLSILNVIPKFAKFNPAGGINLINEMLVGNISTSSNLINISFTLIGSIILFIVSVLIFRKQEI